MANLRDIVAYLLLNYPHKRELSNARVTKMVYLADWRNCLVHGEQLSAIEWVFDEHGPFVWAIKNTAEDNPGVFALEPTETAAGNYKLLLSIRNPAFAPTLAESEVEVLKHVIKHTEKLDWEGFILLVYSTYPILTCQRGSPLDLPELARQYKATLDPNQLPSGAAAG